MDNIFVGLSIGLILPILFLWVYLAKYYPLQGDIREIINQLLSSTVLGKLLSLSIVPNLLIVFVFYKKDMFKIAGGILLGAIVYLITALFLN